MNISHHPKIWFGPVLTSSYTCSYASDYCSSRDGKVVPRSNQTNLIFCTKIKFLNSKYYSVKMLPHPTLFKSNLPLKRAFKWGTVWLIIHLAKVESFFLLIKFKAFHCKKLYFWCPLMYKVTQYLILKLLLVVNWKFEGYIVATFLGSYICHSKTLL